MKDSYLITFWSPFALKGLHFCTAYFSNLLNKFGNIHCLDCQNHSDKKTMRLLHQSDLVIIGLPQNRAQLNDYFCYPPHCFTNVIYLLLDYFSGESLNRTVISHDYRIPRSRLALIPYNARLKEAQRLGHSNRYLDFLNSNLAYEEYIDFQKELKRDVKLCMQALELE